jgi:uncharacterized membrane protein
MSMNHRKLVAAAFAVLLAASPAWATQEYILPTLFDVTDVAADDVLNVRAGPGTGHPVIGMLAPDAERIEVVAHDRTGHWGQVNLGERAGWVSMRYLAYRVDVWEPGELPAALQCFGTEPFWSLRPEDGALVLEAPGEAAVEAPIGAVLDTGVFRDPRRAVVAATDALRMTATMEATACSDQMSDRAYGLSVMVVREEDGEAGLLTGCCRLQP